MTTDLNLDENERLVTVCAECLTAACWHGEFMCERSRHANITQKTVRELRALNRESEHYYSIEKCRKVGSIDARFA